MRSCTRIAGPADAPPSDAAPAYQPQADHRVLSFIGTATDIQEGTRDAAWRKARHDAQRERLGLPENPDVILFSTGGLGWDVTLEIERPLYGFDGEVPAEVLAWASAHYGKPRYADPDDPDGGKPWLFTIIDGPDGPETEWSDRVHAGRDGDWYLCGAPLADADPFSPLDPPHPKLERLDLASPARVDFDGAPEDWQRRRYPEPAWYWDAEGATCLYGIRAADLSEHRRRTWHRWDALNRECIADLRGTVDQAWDGLHRPGEDGASSRSLARSQDGVLFDVDAVSTCTRARYEAALAAD